MKIHWQILKKPSFIIGAIVFFFVLLFFLNRSSASTAATTTVTTGPTDAQVAAQTQLALAQISAGAQGQAIQAQFAATQDQDSTQVQLAAIAAAAQNAQTAAAQAVAQQQVSASVHGLDLQYQTAVADNNAQIQALQVQSGTQLAETAINANLQAALSADQVKALTNTSLINSAMGLSSDQHRTETLQVVAASITGAGNSGLNIAPGGGVSTPSAIVNIPTNFLTTAGQLT